MNVLSLFDGISCGQLALQKAGIKVNNYYSSEIDKHAIKVTQTNFPNTIQLGDINNWESWDLPKIDLIFGGSPCFVAGTQVLTINGYKSIEDIKIGDLVLSHTGKWRSVLKIGFKNNVETRIIKGFGNIGIETTNEHPFLSRKMFKKCLKRKSIRLFEDEKWKRAEELTNGDYCCISKFPEGKSFYSDHFWYMIGRYTGDGWYRETKRRHRKNSYIYQFIICCGHTEFEELRGKFDKFGYKYNFSRERTGVKFRICSQTLVEFVKKIGKGASNKIVHPLLWSSSNSNIKSYLRGLMDSDGCYVKASNSFSVNSVSYKLMLGVQQLYSSVYEIPVSFGVFRRPKTKVIEGRVVNQKDTFCLRYKMDKRKQDKAFYENGKVWMPIKSNTSTDIKKTVYNLEVEIDNSYTANNFVVHNCQSFSKAGNQLGFEGKSGLFYTFLNVLRKVAPTYFLMENVEMKKEWEDEITSQLGVDPVKINSKLVSAQSRPRIYWANFGFSAPQDKGILLSSVIEESYDGIWVWPRGVNSGGVKDYGGKSPSMTVSSWSNNFLLYKKDNPPHKYNHTQKAIDYLNRTEMNQRFVSYKGNEKSPCITANFSKGVPYNVLLAGKKNQARPEFKLGSVRRFTPEECEKLQTLPLDYTACISDTQRYKSIGNGWTVDVIAHILSFLPKNGEGEIINCQNK